MLVPLPLRAKLILLAACLPILPLHADDRASISVRTAESAVTPVNKNPQRHAGFMARKNQGPIDLLFLGASITDFWPQRGPDSWAKFAPYHPANFGVAGDSTEHVLWRITNGELDGLHPKVLVLNLGNNNIGNHPDERTEWVVAGLRKVVDVIHAKLPDTTVLVLAIFPRDGKDSSNRHRNDAVNVELAKFDDGNKTRYLDFNHVFLDADGNLLPGVLLPDHLHPTAKGYDLWYTAMEPTLAALMK